MAMSLDIIMNFDYLYRLKSVFIHHIIFYFENQDFSIQSA